MIEGTSIFAYLHMSNNSLLIKKQDKEFFLNVQTCPDLEQAELAASKIQSSEMKSQAYTMLIEKYLERGSISANLSKVIEFSSKVDYNLFELNKFFSDLLKRCNKDEDFDELFPRLMSENDKIDACEDFVEKRVSQGDLSGALKIIAKMEEGIDKNNLYFDLFQRTDDLILSEHIADQMTSIDYKKTAYECLIVLYYPSPTEEQRITKKINDLEAEEVLLSRAIKV